MAVASCLLHSYTIGRTPPGPRPITPFPASARWHSGPRPSNVLNEMLALPDVSLSRKRLPCQTPSHIVVTQGTNKTKCMPIEGQLVELQRPGPTIVGAQAWSASPVTSQPASKIVDRKGRLNVEASTHGEMASSATAKRAMARQDDVPLMGAIGARVFVGSIHGGTEEVRAGVDARCVDVEVFGKVAHLARSSSQR